MSIAPDLQTYLQAGCFSRQQATIIEAIIDYNAGLTNAAYGPAEATYFVLSANATLTQERVLTLGTGLSAVDDGAGSTYTINVSLAAFDTDDIAEGAANLYFTIERAQDAIGAAIALGTGDGATLDYTDGSNSLGVTNTDKGSDAVAAHVLDADPHTQYLTEAAAAAGYQSIDATLTAAIADAPANLVWCGPSSGADAAPTFRSLVATDIPTLTLAKISDAGTAAAANTGTSGGTVPLCNTSITWGAIQRIEAAGDTLTLASALPRLVLEETDGSADAFFCLNNGLLYVGTSASTSNRWFDITLSTGATRFGGAVTMVAGLAVTGAISATTTIKGGSATVATLAAGSINMRSFVTDATATLAAGIGTVVAGGGANSVPVVHDGTNWRIG